MSRDLRRRLTALEQAQGELSPKVIQKALTTAFESNTFPTDPNLLKVVQDIRAFLIGTQIATIGSSLDEAMEGVDFELTEEEEEFARRIWEQMRPE